MVTAKLLITTTIILSGISTIRQSLAVKDSRRFILESISYDCKECYECYCKLRHCPAFNPFEWVGAYSSCINRIKDYDCSVPYLQQGQWTSWGEWSECMGSCKYSNRHRSRNCTNPEPKNCGKPCDGEAKEYDDTCKPNLCKYFENVGLGFLSKTSLKTSSTPMTSFLPSQTSVTKVKTTPVITSPKMTSTPVVTLDKITSTPASTSVSSLTSTAAFKVNITCAKLCAISAVANKESQHRDGAKTCPDGSNTSSEALSMSCCGLSTSSQWRTGAMVMKHCGMLPQYLPVASFKDGRIQPGSEGIFIDCLQPPEVGFQIIQQNCSIAPSIIHIDSKQTSFPDPYSYYIVS